MARESETRAGVVVEVREIVARLVVSTRARARGDEVGAVIVREFDAIFDHLHEAGVPPAGAPVAVFHDAAMSDAGCPVPASGGDAWEMELAVPVRERVAGAGRITGGEIPGGRVASVLHIGPYEELSRSYAALTAWLRQHGHATTGPPREIYLTDPDEVPDPADYRTEIVWPIR